MIKKLNKLTLNYRFWMFLSIGIAIAYGLFAIFCPF